MRVLLEAPILTQSGYGEHARLVYESLKQIRGLDMYIVPLPWGNTAWSPPRDQTINDNIEKFQRYMTQCQAHDAQPVFDMQVHVGIPFEFTKRANYSICVTAGIETDRVSHTWLEKTKGINKLIVPSQHAKDGFVKTKYEITNHSKQDEVTILECQCPVEVVPYPVKDIVPEQIDLDLETEFNFLTLALFGPRKNLNQTIEWFIKEFRNDADVGLILKTGFVAGNKIDRAATKKYLKTLISGFGEKKCKIYLLHGSLSEEKIHGLYNNPKIKAVVSTTHGEGYGLPLFEAAYSGMPVVATDWSAHLDFLTTKVKQKKTKKLKDKKLFARVEYELKAIQKSAEWENILVEGSKWAYPNELSFRKQIRNVKSNYSLYKSWAKTLKKDISISHEKQKILKQMSSAILGDQTIEYLTVNDQTRSKKKSLFDRVDSQIKKVDRSKIPKISIITSVYDADNFIKPFLEDITRQTIFREKCELILINANSPGNEEPTILEYANSHPDNIIYKRLDHDPGIYGVWNMAVEMASGKFITNANLDDRHAIDFMEQLGFFLSTNEDADLVYSENLLTFHENETFEENSSQGQIYPAEDFSIESMLRGNAPHCMPMWRKTIHDKNGFFDDKYKSAADWDFWLRCALNGSKFKKYYKPLGLYYFNPKGVSTDTDNAVWKSREEREVFKKHQASYLARAQKPST